MVGSFLTPDTVPEWQKIRAYNAIKFVHDRGPKVLFQENRTQCRTRKSYIL